MNTLYLYFLGTLVGIRNAAVCEVENIPCLHKDCIILRENITNQNEGM